MSLAGYGNYSFFSEKIEESAGDTVETDPLCTGEPLISTNSTANNVLLRALKQGSNITISTDANEDITIAASGTLGVNTVDTATGSTGTSLINATQTTPNDIKLNTIKAGTGISITPGGTDNSDLTLASTGLLTAANATGFTGVPIINATLSDATNKYLNTIKAGAGVTVTATGTNNSDILISAGTTPYSNAQILYLDASYTGTSDGTAAQPYKTFDEFDTAFLAKPNGTYVLNIAPGAYTYSNNPFYEWPCDPSVKCLNGVGSTAANVTSLGFDIHFTGAAGPSSAPNFQINTLALVGTTTTDFSLVNSFFSVSYINGFLAQHNFTGSLLTDGICSYSKCGVGGVDISAGTLEAANSFILGVGPPITVDGATSKFKLSSCQIIGSTISLENSGKFYCSGLISTSSATYLSDDGTACQTHVDDYTASLTTYTPTGLATYIIENELETGNNITITQNTTTGKKVIATTAAKDLTELDDCTVNGNNICLGTVLLSLTGSNNVILTNNSGQSLVNSNRNVVIGNDNFNIAVSGADDNTAVGYGSLTDIGAGSKNCAFGSGALANITTGSQNVAFGYNAGQTALLTGTDNVCLGHNAQVDTAGSTNRIAIGSGVTNTLDNSLFVPSNLVNNAASTKKVLLYGSDGQIGGIADGSASQFLQTDGAGHISWATGGGGGATNINGLTDGYSTGIAMSLGTKRTNISGFTDCIIISNDTTNVTGGSATSGSNTILIGNNVAKNDLNLSLMTIVGHNSAPLVTGIQPIACFGSDSLTNATTGTNHVFGNSCLQAVTSGSLNVVLGYGSGNNLTSSSNLIVGYNSGNTMTTGGTNTILGNGAECGATVDGSVALGYLANATVTSGFFVNASTAAMAGSNYKTLTFDTTTGQIGHIANGSNGQVLTISGGLPSWQNAGSSSPSYISLKSGSANAAVQAFGTAGAYTTIASNGSDLTFNGTTTITVNTTGHYRVFASIEVYDSSLASGHILNWTFKRNGSQIGTTNSPYNQQSTSGNNYACQSCELIQSFTATDTITVETAGGFTGITSAECKYWVVQKL